MTILPKPSIDKKGNFKLPLPLGLGSFGKDHMEKSLLGKQAYIPQGASDVESVNYNQHPNTAFSCIKNGLTVLLILVTILLGIFGGYIIYRSFGNPDNATKYHYRTLCDVPYEAANSDKLFAPRFYQQSDDMDLNLNWLLPHLSGNRIVPLDDSNFFREEIEIDMSDDESYTKINVPDFKDGRHGRFMHDFKENQSAIIDATAKRCFIMPLDRNTTLPPKSFIDLMEKMGSGYYNIDTDRVRRNMRVVIPPITDLTLISERIANECYDMKVYMLENYVSGVFKREAKPISSNGKFAEYSGKGVVEFDLINIADIEEYERQHPK
ncbi:integral membrane protein 2C [Musca vetustissima]|uniref:integral membrane protein 2C n=1 Tax=Musca vetustissima TaxID=27455 RepID=UPI002AB73C3C|nr:integral membrane protein 2C [Musca vetustissima]